MAIPLRNLALVVAQSADDELRGAAASLEGMVPDVRRKWLVAWVVRSRQRLAQVHALGTWLSHHDGDLSLEGVARVEQRVVAQRVVVDKAARRLEVGRDAGWAQWGRAPDVATALSALGRGSFDSLPRHVFAAGAPSAPSGLSFEEALSRRERAAQLAVMDERSLPAGALAAPGRGGLIELSVPSLFVAFLSLQPSGEWQARSVEMLVGPKGSSPPFSEQDLSAFAAMANESMASEHALGAGGRPLAAACATLGAIAGRSVVSMLEAQARRLAREWPLLVVERTADGAPLALRLRPWGGITPCIEVTSRARMEGGSVALEATLEHKVVLKEGLLEGLQEGLKESLKDDVKDGVKDGATERLGLDPTALSASDLFVEATFAAADRALAALAVLLGASLVSLECLLALPPGLVSLRRLRGCLELQVAGAAVVVAGVDLKTGRVHVRSLTADPSLARHLERVEAREKGAAAALLLAAARGGVLSALAAAARSHLSLSPLPDWPRGTDTVAWALASHCAATELLVALEASLPSRTTEPSFAIVVASFGALSTHGKRQRAEMIRVPLPTPEFVVPAKRQRHAVTHAAGQIGHGAGPRLASLLACAVRDSEALAPLLGLVATDSAALRLPDGVTPPSNGALAQMVATGSDRWGLVLRQSENPPVAMAVAAAPAGGLRFTVDRRSVPGTMHAMEECIRAAGVEVPLLRGGVVFVGGGKGDLAVETGVGIGPRRALQVAGECLRMWLPDGDTAAVSKGLGRFLDEALL